MHNHRLEGNKLQGGQSLIVRGIIIGNYYILVFIKQTCQFHLVRHVKINITIAKIKPNYGFIEKTDFVINLTSGSGVEFDSETKQLDDRLVSG